MNCSLLECFKRADLLEEVGLARLLSRAILNRIAALKQTRGTQEQLFLPLMDLGRVDIEERCQLLDGLLLLDGRDCDLGFEIGTVRQSARGKA
jgi:hypothetical protein